jgi:DNA-binding GntR family transcriptional regulator
VAAGRWRGFQRGVMARPGTFERVYAAIKEQLRRGAYRPGERLEPALLSEQHVASVTPVRDALHRLTGERLVVAPRHEGFRVPVLTERTLRHLYGWHRDLLLLAILNRGPADTAETGPIAGREGVERDRALFLALVAMSGNPEHAAALMGVADRLEPVQRAASQALDSIEQETDEILAALDSRDMRRLRRALVRYHRRRMKIAPELVERLYSGDGAAGSKR